MAERFIPEPTFAAGNATEQVSARLLADMPSAYDTTEGSFAFDLLTSQAIEVEGLYLLLDAVANQAFAQTATGEYLDAKADECGLTRKVGTYATVTLTFTGTNGTSVPSATRVTTVAPSGVVTSAIAFVTTAGGVISGGTLDLDARAVDLGVLSNVSAGALTRMDPAIVGVSAVTNAAGAGGGTDPEDDETLRARVLRRRRSGRGAGTPGDYESWATAVEGVGFAYAERAWSGAGTVRVIVLDPQTNPVTTAVLDAVTSALAANSPIGNNLTVVTPSTSAIAVSATLTLEPNVTLAGVQADVQTNIATYLRGVAPGGVVYLTEVAAVVVQTPGVRDYASFQIGAPGLGTSNLTMGSNVKPVLGTVTLS